MTKGNKGIISCPVEYLHSGEGKAEGRRQEAEGKKRLEGKSFFITDYPDMI
ncbi:MAG: hypothetical protein F6K17_34565 [Okeania sp. SIO3C4]|nr:hypothetical protein [Okeania sp. SIO3B3]NER07330.1 hypothetical protein [Okeania sp. SIO3C4]